MYLSSACLEGLPVIYFDNVHKRQLNCHHVEQDQSIGHVLLGIPSHEQLSHIFEHSFPAKRNFRYNLIDSHSRKLAHEDQTNKDKMGPYTCTFALY